MKNNLKKLLSVILCAVLLFTTASVAFATDDEQSEVLEKSYSCNYYPDLDIVVINYNSKYSAIGEIPRIIIQAKSSENNEITEVYEVSEDKIQMKIFESSSLHYPQIIINTDFCEEILSVEVEAGAFTTDNGEKSAKLNSNNFTNKSLYIKCRYNFVGFSETPADSEERIINYCAIVNRPIEITIEGDNSNYTKLWLEKAVLSYTVNGKTVEINSDSFTPEEPGEYVVRLSLDGVFTEEMTIEVVSEKVAVEKKLKAAASKLKNFPSEFILGLLAFILVPGMGTVGGGAIMINSWEYVSDFFRALFGNPDYSTHIAKSNDEYEFSTVFKNL